MRDSSGKWVTVFTFKEAFPHHAEFVWLVVAGYPQNLKNKEAFRDFVRGYEARATFPHHETIHRIVDILSDLQDIDSERKIVEVQKEFNGEMCIGIQLDFLAIRGASVSFLGINWTRCCLNDDPSPVLVIEDTLLDFAMFPHTSHTATLMHEFIVATLVKTGVKLSQVCGVSADGESAGQLALDMVESLKQVKTVCNLHQL